MTSSIFIAAAGLTFVFLGMAMLYLAIRLLAYAAPAEDSKGDR